MKLRDLSKEAQQVWAAQSAEEKRQLLLKMVGDFAAKGKNDLNLKNFRTSINEARSTRDLDKIAAQLALFPTDRVVK
jgi:hypothetical protein